MRPGYPWSNVGRFPGIAERHELCAPLAKRASEPGGEAGIMLTALTERVIDTPSAQVA